MIETYNQVIRFLGNHLESIQGVAPEILYGFMAFWFCLLVLGLVLNIAGLSTWVERKVAADIQQRIGPSEIYVPIPFTDIKIRPWGLFQFMADGIKLILKEDLMPAEADRPLFKMAPYIVFGASFPVFAAVPIADGLYAADFNIGLLYMFGVASVGVIGILMAGWASGNKYSLYGSMRSAAQIVSYELPLGVTLLTLTAMTGTLNVNSVIDLQSGGFWNWFIFWYPPFSIVMALVFFIAGVAEVNRTPFDLPESESELVAGFHTEYSGIRFGMFFAAEYANMFLIGVLVSILFLGGYQPPYPGYVLPGQIGTMLEGLFWFVAKGYFFVLVMMWMRWTLPRYRVDHLMYLAWKVLIPITFINLACIGIWDMLVR